jgi:hypothetical protein
MKRVSFIALLIYHSVDSQHWSHVKVGYCYFTKNVLMKVLTGMCQALRLAQECKFDVGRHVVTELFFYSAYYGAF